jgi:hypothetical protein
LVHNNVSELKILSLNFDRHNLLNNNLTHRTWLKRSGVHHRRSGRPASSSAWRTSWTERKPSSTRSSSVAHAAGPVASTAAATAGGRTTSAAKRRENLAPVSPRCGHGQSSSPPGKGCGGDVKNGAGAVALSLRRHRLTFQQEEIKRGRWYCDVHCDETIGTKAMEMQVQ